SARLPDGTETTVTRQDNSSYAVIYAPVFTDRSIVEVTEYIKRHVKPVLETIPGVASVQTFGGLQRNVRIWLDSEALRARGLSATDVLRAFRREHVDLPGGMVEGSRIEWSVKTDAEFRSLESLAGLVIAEQDGATVALRDVARIEDGTEDVRSSTTFNGKP